MPSQPPTGFHLLLPQVEAGEIAAVQLAQAREESASPALVLLLLIVATVEWAPRKRAQLK